MLTGPLKQDKDISLSFKKSAIKFGLKIINENSVAAAVASETAGCGS